VEAEGASDGNGGVDEGGAGGGVGGDGGKEVGVGVDAPDRDESGDGGVEGGGERGEVCGGGVWNVEFVGGVVGCKESIVNVSEK